MNKPMTPMAIKHALEAAGYTQVRIALQCKVSKPMVNQVINNTTTSQNVRSTIAKTIGKTVAEIWATDTVQV